MDVGGRWAILRTQWLYGKGGKNFVETIINLTERKDRLKIVADQVGAPTWVDDLSEIILEVAEREAEGIYHAANSRYATWYEVACFIVEQLQLKCEITPCSSDEYPTAAKRPCNSRLNIDKLTRLLGRRPRPWREALQKYLALISI